MKDTVPVRRNRAPRAPFLLLLLVACSALACATAPPLRPVPSAAGPLSTPWVSMPDSWARLQAIEDWLVGPGPEADPLLAVEAELLLAEGRLRYAKTEVKTLPAVALSQRLGAAEGGFRRVLDSSLAEPRWRDRARRGLTEVQGLRGGATPSARTGVLSRRDWGAKAPNLSNLTASRNRWTRITVHHTAMHTSTLGRGTQGEVADAIRGIQRNHMGTNGWGDIGYHFLIDPQGRVWAGRSLKYQGAHASGANNIANLGVCLLGSFDQERPTAKALAALAGLLDDLRREHGIGRRNVFGHCNFKVTECPGRHLMAWVEGYRGALRSAAR